MDSSGHTFTRQLVEGGEDVRVLLRKTSSTKDIDDLAARLLKRNLMFAAVGLRIATPITASGRVCTPTRR